MSLSSAMFFKKVFYQQFQWGYFWSEMLRLFMHFRTWKMFLDVIVAFRHRNWNPSTSQPLCLKYSRLHDGILKPCLKLLEHMCLKKTILSTHLLKGKILKAVDHENFVTISWLHHISFCCTKKIMERQKTLWLAGIYIYIYIPCF